ncbi:MAG: hypothetical protein M1315_04005 [Candidatus Thermoplasmatota archaeon]|nr:hypothetical protein [Candidatus Thermoplasmatota archaeon]
MLNLKHAPRNIRWTAEFHRIKENRKKVTN